MKSMPKQDPVDELMAGIGTLLDEYRDKLARMPMGSRTLGFAIAAGFPPRVAYSVNDMAKITGVDVQTIYAERKAGRLRAIIPLGSEKGFRVPVEEMDRWLEQNTR